MYRSGDEGKTWDLISTEDLMEGISNASSRIWRHAKGASMPDGSNLMYFWSATQNQAPKQLLWVTSDGGVSFELRPSHPTHPLFETIIPHPYFPGVALLVQSTQTTQLWKTEDAGLTFQRIFYPHVHGSRVHWIPTIESPLRIALEATLGITTSTSPFWNYKVVVSDNFFEDYRILVEHTADWRIQLTDDKPAIRSASQLTPPQSDPEMGWNATFPQTWPSFPTPSSTLVWSASYRTSSYSRYDHSIARNPGEHWEPHPEEWKRFAFSFDGVADPAINSWGLMSLSATESYLLAKSRNNAFTILRLDPTAHNEPTIVMSHYKDGSFVQFPNLRGNMIATRYLIENGTYTDKFLTYRSENGGARFSKLMAPSSTPSDPQHLVFTGVGNTAPLIYGAAGSIGALVATATVVNTTTTLPLVYNRTHRPEVGTYFTSDGGYSWQELGAGYQVPEFAARGALIAFAATGQLTRELTFSLDDGQTWRTIDFSTELMAIQNIRVASDMNSRTLFVLAHSTRTPQEAPAPISSPTTDESPPLDAEMGGDSPTEDVLMPLESPEEVSAPDAAPEQSHGEANYSVPYGASVPEDAPSEPTDSNAPVEPPTPRFIRMAHLITVSFEDAFPLCNTSDLELWTPVDDNGAYRCNQGERITFWRRKAGHFCFPQPPSSSELQSQYTWPRVASKEPCPCSTSDFECAPCFEPVLDDGASRCTFACGSDDRATIEARFPTFPYDRFFQMCTVSNDSWPAGARSLSWIGSATVAFQKSSQTVCKDASPSTSFKALEELEDATITCRYPPTNYVVPSPQIPSPMPLITFDHLKLILLMSVSFSITLSCACGLIHSRRILYSVFALVDRARGESDEFVLHEFDPAIAEVEDDAVEMQEMGAGPPDPTTSSDEDAALLED